MGGCEEESEVKRNVLYAVCMNNAREFLMRRPICLPIKKKEDDRKEKRNKKCSYLSNEMTAQPTISKKQAN